MFFHACLIIFSFVTFSLCSLSHFSKIPVILYRQWVFSEINSFYRFAPIVFLTVHVFSAWSEDVQVVFFMLV